MTMASSDETTARPRAGTEGRRGVGLTVCRDGEPVPPALRGAVAAVGNFDGLHLGHRALIAAAREEAAARGRPSAVLTFEPHPRTFFAPERTMFRLTSEATKLVILARLGLDGVFVRGFDAALAALSAEAFVTDLLMRDLGFSGVVVGHDFHFGQGREGSPATMERLCRAHGLACRVVPPVCASAGGAPVSSSAVRAALAEGDIANANAMLGFRWFVEGTVRHGDKRGRTLGFPTANMALAESCGLRHGIYAVRAGIGDKVVPGVASYGRRPTFDDGAPLLETFLFDWSGDLYGRSVPVEFHGFIRGEARFAGAEALIERMQEDAREARALIAAGDGLPSMIG